MEENKIPTAGQFLILNNDSDFRLSKSGLYVSDMMIEFAKLHVTEALKQAFNNSKMKISENATNEYPDFVDNYDDGYVTIVISKDSILNAYPLDLIE